MNDKVVFFLTTDDFYWIRTQGLVGYEPSALTTKPRLPPLLKHFPESLFQTDAHYNTFNTDFTSAPLI